MIKLKIGQRWKNKEDSFVVELKKVWIKKNEANCVVVTGAGRYKELGKKLPNCYGFNEHWEYLEGQERPED